MTDIDKLMNTVYKNGHNRGVAVNDPEQGLSLTETFANLDTITPTVNMTVDKPAVFAIDLLNVDTLINDGIVMEIGGGSRGFSISFGALADNQFTIRAGSGSGSDRVIASINPQTVGYPEGNCTLIVEVKGDSTTNVKVRYWLKLPNGYSIFVFEDEASAAGNWAGGAAGAVGTVDATVPSQTDSSAPSPFSIQEVRYYEDQEVA